MSSRKAIATQVGLLALAGLLLWLAVRSVPLGEVWETLRALEPRDLLLLVALNAATWLLIALRWWLILLGFDSRLPFHKIFRYRLTVFGLSYVTPGPQVGGEVLQVYYPSVRHHVPTPVALAATTVDKSLELLGNFTLMSVGIIVALKGTQLLGGANLPGLLLVLLLLLAPVGLIVRIWQGRHPISNLLVRLERKLSPARRAGLRQTPGLRSLPSLQRTRQTTRHTEELIHWLAHHRPWVFAAAMVATFGALVLLATEFWVMNRILGIPIGFFPALSVLVLVYFAFLLPLPGGLGAMEAALVTGYAALGFTGAQALSMALLIRVRDLAIAAIGLSLGGMGLLERRPLQPRAAEAAAPLATALPAEAAQEAAAPPTSAPAPPAHPQESQGRGRVTNQPEPFPPLLPHDG
jgi:uncharacterized protein (TIRG00374 family)